MARPILDALCLPSWMACNRVPKSADALRAVVLIGIKLDPETCTKMSYGILLKHKALQDPVNPKVLLSRAVGESLGPISLYRQVSILYGVEATKHLLMVDVGGEQYLAKDSVDVFANLAGKVVCGLQSVLRFCGEIQAFIASDLARRMVQIQ